jgi:CheY-like chemotaxis protein
MTIAKTRQVTILVAEDDEDDRFLVKEAFAANGKDANLQFVNDGQELMDYLLKTDNPLPEIIIMDLNMPRKGGHEALQEIKDHKSLQQIPVVVLSTSSMEKDIKQSYQLGANSYICKPKSYSDFLDIAKAFDKYWFNTVALPN